MEVLRMRCGLGLLAEPFEGGMRSGLYPFLAYLNHDGRCREWGSCNVKARRDQSITSTVSQGGWDGVAPLIFFFYLIEETV